MQQCESLCLIKNIHNVALRCKVKLGDLNWRIPVLV